MLLAIVNSKTCGGVALVAMCPGSDMNYIVTRWLSVAALFMTAVVFAVTVEAFSLEFLVELCTWVCSGALECIILLLCIMMAGVICWI